MSDGPADPREMKRQIRAMDEGEGAGPDAPETVEPVHGAGREPAPQWDGVDKPGWRRRNSAGDAHLDPQGTAGVVTWSALRLIARPIGLLRERLSRR